MVCSYNEVTMRISENMIRANIRNIPSSISGMPASPNSLQKPFALATLSRNFCPFVVRIINNGPWLSILNRSSIPYFFRTRMDCQYIANISRIFQ